MSCDQARPNYRCATRHYRPRLLIVLGALILQCACASPGPVPTDRPDLDAGADRAQTPALTAVTVPATLTLEAGTPLAAGNPKLESSLNQLLAAYQQEGTAGAQAFAQAHTIALEDGRVEVEVIVATGALESVTGAIEADGGEVQGHHDTLLQAWVPIAALESLAQRQDVQLIRAVRRAGY